MNNVTTIEPVAMPRVLPVDGNGNSQGVEQLHRDQIPNSFDNPALKQAAEALGYAHDGLAQIDNLRANPHPEHPAAKHARVVREAIDGFDRAWGHKWDSAKAALLAEQRRVEADLERAANLKPNDKHFNAIVGTFQSMNPGEKAKAIDQLIAAQEGPVLAALIEAPLLVTGLTAEQRDGIKLRLFMAVNPTGVKMRDELATALTRMETASFAALKARAKLRQGLDRFDQRAREAEAVANKARSGFAA